MSKSRCSSSGFMRLKALKSKEVDETGVCTNQKAEPRPGPARTEGQSPLSHAGRASFPRQTRTSTDRGAEPSFPGRQSELSQADQDQHRPRGRALLPRQTRTSALDQAAEPCHRMECHTPWARFGAMQVGWGPSAGPSRRRAEPSFLGRQAEQAFSQSAVPNPWAQRQTRTSKTRTSTTEGQSALSRQAEWAFSQTRTSTDRGAEPRAQTKGQSPGTSLLGSTILTQHHKWPVPSKLPAGPLGAKPPASSSPPRPLASPPPPPKASRSPTVTAQEPSLSVRSVAIKNPPTSSSARPPSSVSFERLLRTSNLTFASNQPLSLLSRRLPRPT